MNDERTDPASGDSEHADAVQAGLEQFRRAALEAIKAGRAMLDAAEAVVRDPQAAEAVIRTVGSVARTATEAVAGFASRSAPGDERGADEPARRAPDDPPDDGLERISVG
ncbi:MAG TPA: hypothetical protein VFU14_01380 [Acidimicrobiales bacterium]|nr:hypothetical protein [Acidimicrobiales bacterium]